MNTYYIKNNWPYCCDDDDDWMDACTDDELSCEDGDNDHWDGDRG